MMFLYQPELDLDPANHFGKCFKNVSFIVSLVRKEHVGFPLCCTLVFLRDKKSRLSHFTQGISQGFLEVYTPRL